jgi:hypothetical protein
MNVDALIGRIGPPIKDDYQKSPEMEQETVTGPYLGENNSTY